MGDVAMTVPVLSALCEQYPNIKVTVLTRAFFKPMFSQLTRVEVYEADVMGRHKGVRGLWKLYRELKGLKIEVVADLHNVLRSTILKKFFVLGGFPVVQINKGRAEKKALTASKHKIFNPLKTTHQRYADVFAQLGSSLDLTAVRLLSKEPLSEKILEVVGSDTRKWIGIAPFAAFKGKMYPFDLMKKVVETLNTSEKYSLLLFGGGIQEQNQLETWEKQFPQCVSIAGKLSFVEELALISNLDLMVSMDSGNGHLAAMYGIQVISLWGVTHPYAGFYPFRQDIDNALLSDRTKYPLIPTSIYGNKIPHAYENVMATIRPDEVVIKIERALSKK
ncbi:MAG: glycosyltransferase family 9 protein [Flavobacteriaceae bacterium]